MNRHLSPEEISNWFLGDRDLDSARHVSECSECSREVERMESALREGEQTSLESVAETLATSLEGRVDLLYRAPAGADGADTALVLTGKERGTRS